MHRLAARAAPRSAGPGRRSRPRRPPPVARVDHRWAVPPQRSVRRRRRCDDRHRHQRVHDTGSTGHTGGRTPHPGSAASRRARRDGTAQPRRRRRCRGRTAAGRDQGRDRSNDRSARSASGRDGLGRPDRSRHPRTTAVGLRAGADHRRRRRSTTRRRDLDPGVADGHASGDRRPRSTLPLPRLRPATPLVRHRSHPPCQRRRPDGRRERHPAVPTSPPREATGRLVADTAAGRNRRLGTRRRPDAHRSVTRSDRRSHRPPERSGRTRGDVHRRDSAPLPGWGACGGPSVTRRPRHT